MQLKSLQPPQIILRLLILVEICCEMTILQQVEVVVIFMPYFRSIATHSVCGYCTNMMLISIARAVSRPKVEMLCFKMEKVIASIIYGGVSNKGGPNFTYWGIETHHHCHSGG